MNTLEIDVLGWTPDEWLDCMCTSSNNNEDNVLVENEKPSEKDRKIVVSVFDKLLKYGAASTPKLMAELRYDKRTIQWAMNQLSATESNGLWYLPKSFTPFNWK